MQITKKTASEFTGVGHPDKCCDQISDALTDLTMDTAEGRGVPVEQCRCAFETYWNGKDLIAGGEYALPGGPLDDGMVRNTILSLVPKIATVDPATLNLNVAVRPQASEIAAITSDGAAGDQGTMVGYATTETVSMMPRAYIQSRALIETYEARCADGTLPWGRPDSKSLVVLDDQGKTHNVILSVQHGPDIPLEDLRRILLEKVVVPTVGDIDPAVVKINHKGSFVTGGAEADAGLTGRKIVVDAYGCTVPVGGGAFSGKCPSKVDRSAAYMGRYIATDVLSRHRGGGATCVVQIAYGIGQIQPEVVTAIVDGTHDVSDWVRNAYPDLSPIAIQERLGLWRREGWRYSDTASGGHFGRPNLPWEALVG